MTLLRSLIEFILEERLWHYFTNQEGFEEIRTMFISTLNNFQKQIRHKTLNTKQREFMELFADIEQLLDEVKITDKADNSSLSLWALLGRREEFINKRKFPLKSELNTFPQQIHYCISRIRVKDTIY